MIKYNYITKKIEGKIKSLDKQGWIEINLSLNDWPIKPTEKHLEKMAKALETTPKYLSKKR